ncbi:MAG TPA: hypothetical protein PK760_07545 [Flavobacteriales bacterium]|nr:hypothetical protein [Flavobacteriales bacterium]
MMQQTFYAIGHFLEWTYRILVKMGWLPVTLITVLLFGGLFYWLMLQGRYNRRAKETNTLA